MPNMNQPYERLAQCAVVANRGISKKNPDDIPTPPWATRALIEHAITDNQKLSKMTCWEPACGRGHMARPLAEYFGEVHASDIYDFGFGECADFLDPKVKRQVDWVITHPPFRLALPFAQKALEMAKFGVAMLVRRALMKAGSEFYSTHHPTEMAGFLEQVAMRKGRLDPLATTTASHSWLIWKKPTGNTLTISSITGCREQLERPEDYLEPEKQI